MSESEGRPNLTKIRWETNEQGVITEYACEYLTSTEVQQYNSFPEVEVPSYYDLVYDCFDEPTVLADRISARLVEKAAYNWQIMPKGESCHGTGMMIDNNMIASVSSDPGNRLVDRFSCQLLVPGDGECCTVVENLMTFLPYPSYDEIYLWEFVKDQLDSGSLTQYGETFKTRFIGSVIEEPPQDGTTVKEPPGQDPTVSAVQGASPQQEGGDNNRFTPLGGVIFGAVLAALLGVVLIYARRRRRKNQHELFNEPFPDDVMGVQVLSDRRTTTGLPDGLPYDNEGHEVISNNFYDEGNIRVNITYRSPTPTQSTHIRSLDDADLDQISDDFESSNLSSSYAWDLSNSFHREVMGAHGGGHIPAGGFNSQKQLYNGPTTIEVVPPYPMDETSESEAEDSWAQTDGSVGSLDVNLEQITAEI